MLHKDILINRTETVKNVLKKLDKTAEKTLLVVDKKHKLLGTVTDGDIRRFLLKGGALEDVVSGLYYKKPIYLKDMDFSLDKAKKIFLTNKIELIPILDNKNKVSDFITWSAAFSEDKTPRNTGEKTAVAVPVVIMAGGKSTRLEPFSKVLPKPLIPVGEKPIIELVIDEFKKQGAKKFYIILNYKGEMVRSYLDNIRKDYKIKYIWEKEFLGTAGGLKLLEKEIKGDFIVSNCDIIVKADFREVLNMHKKRGGLLTVISSIHHHKIPYGIITFKKGGEITELFEKPEYSFMINAGVYILGKEALRFIPAGTYFDMTDLIKILMKKGKRIVTYPVNESDYIDMGQWEEYKKAVEKLQILP